MKSACPSSDVKRFRVGGACEIAGLGCFLAIVFLALMCRVFFEDYDMAFAAQLPLTITGDAGCLLGILLALSLNLRSLASTMGACVSIGSSAGLAISLLLKAGFILPMSVEGMLAGDFLASLFASLCAYCWWIVFTGAGEGEGARTEAEAVARFGAALVVGVALFFLANVVSPFAGRMASTLMLPLAMAACFFFLITKRSASEEVSEKGDSSGLSAGKNLSSEESSHAQNRFAVIPPLAAVTLALSFFVVDLELDLFPISLYYEGVYFDTLPEPGVACAFIMLAFAAMLMLVVRKRPIPYTLLYTIGFALTAAGSLATPYRFQGGLPLAASEAGRMMVVCFALLFAFRLQNSRKGESLRVGSEFLMACVIMFCAMLVADVVVVAIQTQEGFDYSDFVFRTVFSGLSIAMLIALVIGPLPRMNYAYETHSGGFFGKGASKDGEAVLPQSTCAAPEANDPKEACRAFARDRGLTSRETDVLLLLANGRDVPYIEKELVVAKSTVRTHIKHIYAKCEVNSRQDLLDKIEEHSRQF